MFAWFKRIWLTLNRNSIQDIHYAMLCKKDYIIEIYRRYSFTVKTGSKIFGFGFGFWHYRITTGGKQLNFILNTSSNHSKGLKPSIVNIRFVKQKIYLVLYSFTPGFNCKAIANVFLSPIMALARSKFWWCNFVLHNIT